jgi:hypothetical protein
LIADIIPISALAFRKATFYSVKIREKELNEFRDFHNRMSKDEKDKRELEEISRFIEMIGKKYGAEPRQFRTEDAAEALPLYSYFESENTDNYGLRLYCIRLSPSVVILLNGDRKTALKVNDCKKCFRHFDLARKLSRKINEAILEGYIIVDEENKELIIEADFEIIL